MALVPLPKLALPELASSLSYAPLRALVPERTKPKLVVALVGSSFGDTKRLASALAGSELRFELKLGQLEASWVSFVTVAWPRRGAFGDPATAGPGAPAALLEEATTVGAASGSLLLEAPHAPELARLALSLIREAPCFASMKALLAVAPRLIGNVKPDWGFDDFILHPYRPEELHWRLKALEQPRHAGGVAPMPSLDNVNVDLAAHEVQVGGTSVALTHKEFELLRCLLERRGHVLSRQQLLAQVWGDEYDGGARTVDTHVRRLRAKLGPSFPLATIRGAGYRLSL